MNPIKTITQLSSHMNVRRRDGAFRYATAMIRSLPNVIMIGAQKSGTTSLFKYLEQHPHIEVSKTKEVHYFDNYYHKGALWYRSHFPIKRNSCIMEASPSYLFYPHAPKRIHTLLPDVKLIAILRNPTERAISSYFHQVRAGTEKLPIFEALKSEEERITLLRDKILKDEAYVSLDYLRFSYKQRGIYIEQLERYWELFDCKKLLILHYEEFRRDLEQTLQKIYSFIGIKSNIGEINFQQYNIGANKQEISPHVYDYLDEYFKPYNQKLYERLGLDFNW